MGRQKLHYWHPSGIILRELLVNGYAKHEESGFVITLNDINGAAVEIVYDRFSQMIGD